MHKLPIFRTAAQAYAFVWLRRDQFWSLAVPAIAIVAITSALTSWLQWLSMGQPTSLADFMKGTGNFVRPDASLTFFVVAVAGGIVSFAVLVLYSVAWHRLYLVPAGAATPASAYRWQGRQTKFFLNYLRVFIVLIPFIAALAIVGGIIAAGVGAMVGKGGGANTSVAGITAIVVTAQLLLLLCVGWFWGRFAMLFPATAVDQHMKLREGWRFSRGNGWRILWIIVLTTIPIWIVSTPLNFGMQYAGFETGLTGSLTVTLIFALITQFFAFVGIAIGVSALSISYQFLSANQPPPEAAPGAE